MNKLFKKSIKTLFVCSTLFSLVGCNNTNNQADLVVYSKIYTSNSNHDYVEAFAVKDGKYIYVGDRQGANKYIKSGVTTIIDRSNNGLVMAGATEGHGHYVMSTVMEKKGLFMDLNKQGSTTESITKYIIDFLKNIVNTHPNDNMYLTYGWNNLKLKGIKESLDMRSELDKISSTKIIIAIDDTGHNIFMNSKAIEAAKFPSSGVIEGGFLSKDSNGKLLGLAEDVAMNWAMKNILTDNKFLSTEDFTESIKEMTNKLHNYGYTNYLDAYTSYFGGAAYEGLYEYDKKYGLTINVNGCYKIDPFEDVNSTLETAVSYSSKYTSTHFKANGIKLFADGECVESKSGWVINPYKDGSYGVQVWKDEDMYNVVKLANQKGLSVHVHASGDAATKQAVDAFVKAEPTAAKGVLNGLGHSRHITEETLNLMAQHNIYSATNVGWRIYADSQLDYINSNYDYDWYMSGYPLKSLFDKGITITGSTDYPSTSGSPCDILNLIEMATNGTYDYSLVPEGEVVHPLNTKECITVQQALDLYTINGAKEMGLDSTRGSIEVGKYADFLFLDQDITNIDLDKIHTAKIESVYFEGKVQ